MKHVPSEKSPEIENVLEKMFGRTTAIDTQTCSYCKKPVTAFRDALSEKEYSISGLCQKCQDEVFGR